MPCRIQGATKRLKLIPLPTLESSLDYMLLEYVLGQTQSYCLRITLGAASVMVPSGRKHEDVVDNYLSAIKSRQSEIGPAENPFSMLLSPVIGREPQTKLIVVPDAKLNLLPFDALRDLEGRYVLESHTVTYAPSATVLHLLRESRYSDRATRDFLGVGGVIYSNLTAAMTTRASNDSRKPNVIADFFRPDAVTHTPISPEAHKKLSNPPASFAAQSSNSSIETPRKPRSKRYRSPIFGSCTSPFTTWPTQHFPTGPHWFWAVHPILERTVCYRSARFEICPFAPGW